jgi:ferredoxin
MLKYLSLINKTLNNISQEIIINPDRCLKFLSKYDTCGRCENICPNCAININKKTNKITVNHNLCTYCGLCVSFCPLTVFEFKYIGYIDLFELTEEYYNKYKKIIFICEKFIHQKNLIKTTNGINIPCIGILDYSLLIHMFLLKPENITIYSDCSNCKNKAAFDFSFILNKEINSFLSLFNFNNIQINCKNKFDDDTVKNIIANKCSITNEQTLTRREVFNYYKNHFVTTTKKSFHIIKEESTDVITKNNHKKKFIPLHRLLFLKDLKNIINAVNKPLKIDNFSFLKTINIDFTKCNMCSICYIFCPTGALIENSEKDENGILRKKGINIIQEKCINCDFCVNICPKNAINYVNSFTLNDYIA